MSTCRPLGILTAWGLASLLVTACTFPQTPHAPPASLQADAPSSNRLWFLQERTWLLRQTALLEAGTTRLSMNALLQLDMAQSTARLVAIDDFGVKLFDLTVTTTGEEPHFLLPALARIPGIDRMIAASLRRIYLPLVADNAGKDVVGHLVGGEAGLLLERSRHASQENWHVRYLSYREAGGALHPVHIVEEDQAAGYRLTVWTEEVKENGRP